MFVFAVTFLSKFFSASSCTRADISTSSLFPTKGSVLGGNNVTVRGRHFEDTTQLACFFGSVRALSTRFLNEEEVACVAPPNVHPNYVTVSVTLNGAPDASQTSVVYQYVDEIRLWRLDPPLGTALGGTILTIYGSSMLDTEKLECQIGNHRVAARWVSSSQIEIVTPPAEGPGRVNVSISVNGQDFTSQALSFMYYEPENVMAVSPLVVSSPAETSLQVSGSGFKSGPLLTCVIGQRRAPAVFINGSHVECLVDSLEAGTYGVWVSNNGQNASLSGAELTVLPVPVFTDINPASGWLSGGTVVRISGKYLPLDDVLECFFGGQSGGVATILTTSVLICTTPPRKAPGPVNVAIHMRQRKDTVQTPFIYEYGPEPLLISASPSEGSLSGDYRVNVSGYGFIPSGMLRCRFGGVASPAQYVSFTSISCTPPDQVDAKTVPLDVTLNGQQYTSSGLTFTFLQDVQMASVEPQLGHVGIPTMVHIKGSGFQASSALCCRFNGTKMTPATFLNRTDIKCLVMASMAGTMEIAVSNDCQTFPSSGTSSFNVSLSPVVHVMVPERGSVSGGTLVSLRGDHFTSNTVCLFGDLPALSVSVLSPSLMVCSTPAVLEEGSVALRLTVNGLNTVPTGYRFWYVASYDVWSLTPESGPVEGGTSILVNGENFRSIGDIMCAFGNQTVPAYFISTSTMECFSPPVRSPGKVQLFVRVGDENISSPLDFYYYESPILTSITQSSGGANGGTTVSVLGSNFLLSTKLRCRFGLTEVAATYLTSSEVLCIAPQASPLSRVNISVSNNGQDYPISNLEFTYLPLPVVQGVNPTLGPKAGGTSVTITGIGFRNSTSLQCRFGDVDTAVAAFVDEQNIVCIAPKDLSQDAGAVSVSISTDGLEWYSGLFATYTYVDPPRIFQVVPEFGSLEGGTLVVLKGAGFVDGVGLKCVFGNETGSAVWVSPSRIECISPHLDAGPVDISISYQGQIYYTGATYTSVKMPTLDGVSPSYVFMTGGDIVNVTGNGFSPSSLLACSIDGVSSAGIFINPNLIQCRLPSLQVGTANLSVTNNGVDFTTRSIILQVQPPLSIASVSPLSGRLIGGTVVRIQVSNAVNGSDNAACYFDGIEAPSLRLINARVVECITPPKQIPSDVVIELRMGGAYKLKAPVPFTYIQDPRIWSVHPTTGPATGGTIISLRGSLFVEVSNISCRLADYIVPARWLSEAEVECVVPPRSGDDAVSIFFSFNGQDYIDSGHDFLYQDELSIQNVEPTSVSHTGGTQLTITGKGFTLSSSLICRFGDLLLSAAYVNETTISCTSPPYSAGEVLLQVSNNQQDFSSPTTLMVVQRPLLLEMTPKYGSVLGGTIVAIVGEDIPTNNGTVCLFDGIPSTLVKTISSAELLCETPAMPNATIAHVWLQIPGQQLVETRLEFHYVPSPVVKSIAPVTGPPEGGTPVIISGDGFSDVEGLSCLFGPGSVVSGRWLSAQKIQCVSPKSSSGAGSVPLSISVNGVDFSGTTSTFAYVDKPRLYRMKPNEGPSAGGIAVVIQGSGFYKSNDLLCRFNLHTMPAVFINTSYIACTSPPLGISGPVAVTVSNNALEYSDDVLSFTPVAPISLWDLQPKYGKQSGGTLVTVRGTGFAHTNELTCFFGSKAATTTAFIHSTQIQCTSPASNQPGNVNVSVSLDGVNQMPTVREFKYLDNLRIWSIWPPSGPRTGGNVLISGYGFYDTDTLTCRFGGLTAPGRLVSSGEIECYAPAVDYPGTVGVRVSVNGVEYSEDVLKYTYISAVSVNSADPLRGLSSGGTEVVLSGHGLSGTSGLKCWFGATSSAVHVVDNTTAFCISVRSYSEEVNFYVTDGTGKNLLSPRPFLFDRVPSPEFITPSEGPLSGGTTVNVSFSMPLPSLGIQSLYCVFGGSIRSPLQVIGASTGRCNSPAGTAPGNVPFKVQLENGSLWSSAHPIYFEYNLPISAIRVSPTFVAQQSTADLLVVGSGFSNSASLACRLGENGPLIPARWRSSSAIDCLLPGNMKPGSKELYITNNGIDFFNTSFVIEVIPRLVLSNAIPLQGSKAGGTRVIVVGSIFPENGIIQCAFGDQLVDALFVNASAVVCFTKAHPMGEVTLRVCLEGVCGDDSLPFSFIPSISVSDLIPTSGSVLGGMTVTVTGNGFVGDLLGCQFGDALVPGRIISPSVMLCISPPGERGPVPFAITGDSITFSQEEVFFTYQTATIVTGTSLSSVSEIGGATLRVYGGVFLNAEDLTCFFRPTSGNKTWSSSASWISETVVTCDVPPMVPGRVEVLVASSQSALLGARGVNLMVFPAVTLHSISPGAGPLSGSSLVTVRGSGFFSSSQLSCRFGSLSSKAIFLNGTTLACMSPSANEPGGVPFTIQLGGFDLCFNYDTTYRYIENEVLLVGVEPAVVHLNGDANVTLSGAGLRSPGLPPLLVRLKDQYLDLTVQSDSQAYFLAPPSDEGWVTIELANSITREVLSSSLALRYVRRAIIMAARPASGSFRGGTAVKVIGRHFVPSVTFACFFGEVPAASVTVTASTEAICISPPHLPGSVNLRVSNNNDTFSSETVIFTYGLEPLITSMTPSAGSRYGGTIISIEGEHFGSFSTWNCMFGATTVPASLINDTLLRCVSPPRLEAGSELVQLSSNGNDIARQSETFWFDFVESLLTITDVLPRFGYVNQSRTLQLLGSGIVAGAMYCRLGLPNGGTVVVEGTNITETGFSCILPSLPLSGLITIDVSSSAAAGFTAARAHFSVYEQPILAGIFPTRGSEGGNTSLVLRGFNFVESTSVLCRFQRALLLLSTPGRLISDSEILCVTPKFPPGDANVSISLDDDDFITGGLSFMFDPIISIVMVTPSVGYRNSGGKIGVWGTNFVMSPHLACRLGTVSVRATYVNSSYLICSPHAPTVEDTVTVEVTVNGVDYTTDGHTFIYYDEPVVSSLSPSAGTQSGGTRVVLKGQGLQMTRFCVFGDVTVPAIDSTPTMVSCVSPSLPTSGPVKISVGLEELALKMTGFIYTFQAQVNLLSASPLDLSEIGGQIISVTGMNFVNSKDICCKIGDKIVPATWYSSNAVSCVSPPMGPVMIMLEVSNNCKDFGVTSLLIRYHPCPQLSSIEPSQGPSAGGTKVLIRGKRFTSSGLLNCRFGEIMAPAAFINSTAISCVAPKQVAGTVTVQVSQDDRGVDVSPGSLIFEYVETAPSLMVANPTLGPISGGTPIRLKGSGFFAWAMFCRFRWSNGTTAVVAACNTSTNALLCRAPVASGPGVAKIDVSFNGRDFTSNAVSYRYVQPATVQSVWPIRGPETGGSRVKVTGMNFIQSSEIFCRFGKEDGLGVSQVKGILLDSGAVECQSSPSLRPGSYAVGVSFNGGVDYSWSTAQVYAVDRSVTMHRAIPQYGFVTGGTVVTIIGTNFIFSGDLTCAFGDGLKAQASFVNESAITCVSPRWSESPDVSGAITIDVSINGRDFTGSSAVTFNYVPLPEVRTAYPSSGPPRGNTLVSIWGARFTDTGLVTCRFGSTIVPGVVVSDQLVTCRTPVGQAGEVPVSLSINMVDYTSLSVTTFKYLDDLSVSSIDPTSGSYTGGTLVSVTGAGFRNAENVCRFGSSPGVIVPARWVANNELQCRAPAGLPSIVTIEVSNNGQDFSQDGVVFEYFGEPIVLSMYPDNGPVRGGTPVVIRGRNFNFGDRTICRFGTEDARAVYRSPTELLCTSPAQRQTGIVSFNISMNGIDFLAGLEFRYVDLPSVIAVSPVLVTVGESREMTIHGKGFEITPNLTCKFYGNFGDGHAVTFVSPAQILPSGSIACMLPIAFSISQTIRVEVSNNGFDFSSSGVTYKTIPLVRISSFKPMSGPEMGDTLVKIQGYNFLNVDSLGCKFGNISSPFVTWQSSSEMWCKAPRSQPGSVPISVTLNGVDYVTHRSLTYYYDTQIEVVSLAPLLGSVDGGTKLAVYGRNFLASPSLACRFYHDVVPARFISPNEIHCLTPPHVSGIINVGVSVNGQDFAFGTGAAFTYTADIQVAQLQPNSGPTEGNTHVFLTGENFQNSSLLACRFGTKIVTATFHSSSMVSCISPAVPSTLVGAIPVSLSSNGADFSTGDVIFLFRYFRSPRVVSLSRTSVPEKIDTKIIVSGSDFVDSKTLECKFGDLPASTGRWLSPSLMACWARNTTRQESPYRLHISNNGQDFIDSGFDVQIIQQNVSLSFSPSSGPETGGTLVTVVTTMGLKFTGLQVCKFGDNIVPATVDTERALALCRTPPRQHGNPWMVPVAISLNGFELYSAPVNFTYTPTARILSLLPVIGPLSGGTSINVTGTGFNMSGMFCRFTVGTSMTVIRAEVLSATSLVCLSPGQSSPVQAIVEVSQNGADFTDNHLTFAYHGQVRLWSSQPRHGPEAGGTLLRIRGFGFVSTPQLSCRFSLQTQAVSVPALWVSSELITCRAPPHNPGKMLLTVSLNGQDFMGADDRVYFQYDWIPSVFDVNPKVGSVVGGTTVVITGPEFELSGALSCRFGVIASPAVFVNRSAIQCVAPASAAGEVQLQVTQNGWDYFGNATFLYVNDPVASWIYPTLGWLTNSTMVMIRGRNIDSSASIFCVLARSVLLPAYRTGPDIVSCTIPPYESSGLTQTTISVGVVVGGWWTKWRAHQVLGPVFRYLPPAMVTMAIPNYGPEQGGTVVRVYGENFVNDAQLNCSFGEDSSVPAFWVSSTVIECISPRHPLGGVSVSVVTEGLDAYSTMATFEFQHAVQLYDLSPVSGSSAGGTVVWIYGDHFVETSATFCRFGIASPVSAVVVNKTTLSCRAPQHMPGPVDLQVTTNDADYSIGNLTYTFTDMPSVYRLWPTMGPSRGGTAVQVTGSSFSNTTGWSYTCTFGNVAPVCAVYVSDTLILCTTPAASDGEVTTVAVEVQFKGSPIRYSGQVRGVSVFPASQ